MDGLNYQADYLKNRHIWSLLMHALLGSLLVYFSGASLFSCFVVNIHFHPRRRVRTTTGCVGALFATVDSKQKRQHP